MVQALLVLQIIVGLLIIVLVVLQSKGTGIGSTFGGDMGFYGTKRGAEKMLFYITIALTTIFCISSLISVVISH